MPVAKPTVLPDWASSATGIAQSSAPPSQDILDGWAPGYRPPAQYFNWLQRQTTNWLKWLQDITNQALTWTGSHTFNTSVNLNGGATMLGTLSVPVLAVTTQASFPGPAYTNLSGNTGWTFSGGTRYAHYWRDSLGFIHLEAYGSTTVSVPNVQIFSSLLPASARAIALLPIQLVYGTSSLASSAATIDGNGQIAIAGNVPASGDNVYISGCWYGH